MTNTKSSIHANDSFEEQGDLIWKHLGMSLHATEMNYHDLVSLRTYLMDSKYDEANVRLLRS